MLYRFAPLLLLSALLLASGSSYAQQRSQQTQYMYHRLGFNPAVAGSKASTQLTAIYRQQWIGLEGAPSVQALSLHGPLANQRVGLGLNIVRQSVGIQERIRVDAAYAYRVRLGDGHLGIGLQGSLESMRNDWQDSRIRTTTATEQDGQIPQDMQQRLLPNFGTGLYYHSTNAYLGVSAPRLLRNDLSVADGGIVSREATHLYFMGGIAFALGENVAMRPQFLLQYVPDAPPSADLNLSLLFAQTVIVGGTYRTSSSPNGFRSSALSGILAIHLSKKLLFGMSYDHSLTLLGPFQSGSAEGVLQINFGESEDEVDEYINPRFF